MVLEGLGVAVVLAIEIGGGKVKEEKKREVLASGRSAGTTCGDAGHTTWRHYRISPRIEICKGEKKKKGGEEGSRYASHDLHPQCDSKKRKLEDSMRDPGTSGKRGGRRKKWSLLFKTVVLIALCAGGEKRFREAKTQY